MKPRRIFSAARLSLPLASALVALMAISSAHSQLTWDPAGGGASDGAGAWLTAGDWWNGTTNVNWASGSDATFGNGGAGGAVTLASPTTIGSLTFNSFTGTYTLGTAGQTITLNNGITMNSGAGIATIISPITLGAAQSWLNNDDSLLTIGTGAVTNGGFLLTVGGSGNTTISSVIGGLGGLTKSGAGVLTLSGANTFSGQLTVSTGTLSIGSINAASAAGTLGNSALAVILGSTGGNTGTLRYTGASANSSKVFSLAAGGTGEFDVTTAATNLILTGNNTGTGNLTKSGSGVLTLSGTNGAYGSIAINAGALQLGYGGTTGSLSTSSAISIGAGAVFAINRTNAVTQGATFSNAAISGDGGFSQYGTGTTTLNLANTYKGATTISGGTLSIGAANNLGDAASNLVFNGGLLQITGTALTSFTTLGRTVVFNDSKVIGLDINNAANTFTFGQALPTAGLMLAGAGTVVFQNSVSALTLNTRTPTGAAQTVTYGGAIGDGTGARSITKIGAGTQVLQGNNGYTGATSINAGTLTLSGAAGALASTSIALNGGNLTLDNATNLGTRISNSATIAVNGSSSLTFTHGGTAAVDYSESIDTLSLQSGFLTYTGSQANATGPRTSNLQFNTLSRSGTATANFAGTGLGTNGRNTIKFGAGVTDATDLGPWAVVNGADFASYSTANGIVAATSSTLAINSNSSTTNFNTTAGSITFDSALNPSLKTLLVTGGTVRTTAINGNTVSVGGISSTGATHVISGAGAVQALAAGDALYVNVGANTLTFSSVIQNVGAGATASTLVKYGNGQLTLGGTNTYTGGTVVNAGTLAYSADANLGASGSRNVTFAGTGTLTGFNGSSLNQLTVNSGAVANISANNITFATTTGSGDIVNPGASSTLNLGNASGFMGNVRINTAGGGPTVLFSNMGDATGAGNLQYAGGSGDGSQTIAMALSGNTGALTLNNRRIEFIPKPLNWSFLTAILRNDNATAANKFVINTNLLNNNDRNHNFQLGGTNTGENEFAGVIGNSTLGYMYDGIFGGGNMAANGVLSLIKADAGRWILSGSNTYTGATTVNAGILQVTNLTNGGSASSIGASSNAAGNLLLANGTTLRYTGSGHSTDRRFTLNVSAAGHGAALDASGTGAVNFTNSTSPAYGTVDQTRTLTLTGTNTGNNTLAAAIANNGSGAVSINKTGIGTWVLSGASNSFTGTTALSGGGKLVLDYTSDTTKLANGAALTLGGGEMTLRGGNHVEQVGSLTIGGGANTSITRDGGSATIALGAISKAQTNGGTLSIAVDNLATTTSTVFNGILGGGVTVGSNWAKVVSGNIVALTAGDYTALPTGGTNGAVNYQLTGSQTRAAGASVNSLRISGDGDDQVLTITSGNLTPSTVTGVGTLGNSGGILYAGGGNNNYTITGAGSVQGQNGNQELIINTFQGTLTLDMAVTTGNGNGSAFGSGLTKTGLGTLVLTKASTHTAATYVNQGILRLRHAGALASTTTGATFVQNGAALELDNNITVGAEALTITGNGSGSNTGALRNVASNTSSYAGAVTIGNGGARINSDASGALTLTGGIVTSQFNNVTIGGAGNTAVSTVAISGAGGLVKDGLGTTTLSATNTYTGTTTVSDGTLLVNNTTGSGTGTNTVSVVSGATLGGTGTIGGVVNVSGVLSPGASIQTLGTGTLSFANGSTLFHELNSGVAASLGSDLLIVTGDLNLAGTVGLSLSDLALTNVEFIENNVFSLINYTGAWNGGLFTYQGNELANNEEFTFGLNNWRIRYDAPTGGLNFAGEHVAGSFVNLTVIPEPSSVALLGTLGAMMLLRRRR
jgi:hypothetical protein